MHSPTHYLTLLFLLTLSTASPLWWDFTPSAPTTPHLLPRGSASVNPNAVTDTVCSTAPLALNFHDTNVALLSICGGISGKIEQCGGSPQTTTGASGTSKFTLTANQGATINVSKGRWEGCVRAARAVCSEGFTSHCVGGTSDGKGFTFVLGAN